ncbi:MAG TPA: ribonuclease E/G [Deltaproteobacteria bacterium]|jgi:ribonuclease E|nr:ribonuclease E/G [Bacteriovoracaceae bacterium]HNR50388.1 ribonuclease E/G [Deltaproteobacteria bacterium]HRR68476.1 ribonuclease E/G [Desulfomonilia bacterium]HOS25979.1 ribonuclease E/G [Deltaproteobacteria bacterium]HQM21841.1 ribonuclease E/G [Deltaproteobacteria bacterium]
MKKMLINAVHPEEIRVAVVEDGMLKELYIQSALKEQIRGNIYKGRISKIEHSLDAVFVDYGREKHGLLPLNDINWRFVPGAKQDKGSLSLLRKGMEILVQANREEKNAKGALLTLNISIPGRYMVLLPRQDLAGISRKIDDETQRKRLKDIISQLAPPADMGLIVRTAGMDRTKADLQKDLSYLLRLWKSIEDGFSSAQCPSLIYREGDIIIRSIRDYFTSDISEILIDDEETFRRAVVFMKSVMPRHKNVIKHYKQGKPLFTKYDLEQQIQNIYSKKVKLRSGGTLVIEPTEAMVVIDVNSGQSTAGRDIENTALSTNLEATEEIARQLVLRDIGGLVVIDFIDMRSRENMRKVEKALKDALKNDRAHLVVGRISKFGILELSRERLSSTLLEKSYITCAACEGTGLMRSVESSALMSLREIQLYLNRNNPSELKVELPPDVAMYLLNSQRKYLLRLEQDFSVKIDISMNSGIRRGQVQMSVPEQVK